MVIDSHVLALVSRNRPAAAELRRRLHLGSHAVVHPPRETLVRRAPEAGQGPREQWQAGDPPSSQVRPLRTLRLLVLVVLALCAPPWWR